MIRNGNDGGVRKVVSDVMDLCELQFQLIAVDSEEAKRRSVKAVICLAVASVMGLASVTGIVLGTGWLLHEQLQWPVSYSLLAVSGGGLILAAIVGMIAGKLFGKASESLAETKREFAENIKWIKSIISPSTSPRYQLRREDFPLPPDRAQGFVRERPSG